MQITQHNKWNQTTFLLSLLVYIISTLSNANTATPINECDYSLFKQYLLLEKTSYKLPTRAPDTELYERMKEFEILCPWQITQDFNNDNKKDWIGIVIKNHQYYLLAYMSKVGSYQASIIKKYHRFPLETHFDLMVSEEAILVTRTKKVINVPKYAFVENKIGKASNIYLWQTNQFINIGQFEGNY